MRVVHRLNASSLSPRLAVRGIVAAVVCGGLSLAASPAAVAALVVTNGDFSDTADLTVQGGGWYAGLPTGWSTLNSTGAGTPAFSVFDSAGPPTIPFVANLQALGALTSGFNPLYQNIGSLDATGTVTLTFEIRSDWQLGSISVGAGIYPASNIGTWSTPLASAAFSSTGSQTLQAPNVTAGEQLAIAFWYGGGAAPGLDNVVAVPEPTSLALLGLGVGGLAALRRFRR
jgi:hypothetical protein